MYEAYFISWCGRKDKTSLTYVQSIKIRLHKSNLYYCINKTTTNKTKYCIKEQKQTLRSYAPALIKFTGDSSYPYVIKFYGKRYAVHNTGRCHELWNDYQPISS